MGDDIKWRRLMLELPSFVFCLLRGDNEVIGYWCYFPVSKDIYEKGVLGENINKTIDLDDVHDFFIPDEYDLYFVDFFVYQHNLGFATNPKMHASFMKFLIDSAKNGYFIRKIFAHTSSSYSIKLCRNAGFSFVTDHREHRMLGTDGALVPTKIYEFNFENGLQSKLLSLNPKAQAIYAAHFDKETSIAPNLRILDTKIEQIELDIRAVVVKTLDDDWGRVPPHIQQKVDERIASAARKNAAFNSENYADLRTKLEFFDLRELQDLLTSKSFGTLFNLRFGQKDSLNIKFDQLSELRNAIRHSRTVTAAVLKEGEAATLWFGDVLGKKLKN